MCRYHGVLFFFYKTCKKGQEFLGKDEVGCLHDVEWSGEMQFMIPVNR